MKNEKENQVNLKNELNTLNEELGKLKTVLKEKEYKSTIEPLKQLEETLLSKLKQKEQTLVNLQGRNQMIPTKGPSGNVPAGNYQQGGYYVSPKYNVGPTSGGVVSQPLAEGHVSSNQIQQGASNQTIEKLYSEIKELKNLISKQGNTTATGGDDPSKEGMKNILKGNTSIPGKK